MLLRLYKTSSGIYFFQSFKGILCRLKGEEQDSFSSRITQFKLAGKDLGLFRRAVSAVAAIMECETIIGVPGSVTEANSIQHIAGDEVRFVATAARPPRKKYKGEFTPETEGKRVKIERAEPKRTFARVLLIDDVATEGKTLAIYRELLMKAKVAEEVVCFAFGKTPCQFEATGQSVWIEDASPIESADSTSTKAEAFNAEMAELKLAKMRAAVRLPAKINHGGKRSASSGGKLAKDLRALDIYQLRIDGLSNEEIGSKYGIAGCTVANIIAREYSQNLGLKAEVIEVSRALDLARLDQLIEAHKKRAVGWTDEDGFEFPPSDRSAMVVLGAIDRRAKLLGLEAAQKVEVNVQVQVTAIAEAQTGAFPLVIERLEREGWTPEQLERAAYAISLMQETAGERLKALDAAPVETTFEEVKGDG